MKNQTTNYVPFLAQAPVSMNRYFRVTVPLIGQWILMMKS